MSTKRTRIARGSNSHLRLDAARENSLLFGHTLFGRESVGDFANDEERREAWALHRDRLMTELEPGHRPEAYWRFDRAMPENAESEAHGVWLLPETTDEERRQIEAMWLKLIRGGVEWRAIHGEDFRYRDWRHPPAEFIAEHRPAILAEVKAKYPNSRHL
jgi:hypothetical protein